MGQVTLYNTLSRQLEELVPVQPGHVGMYVCGPTVYHDLHVGNFRCFVVFDTVARFLRREGYQVTLVQNFTDVDDRMIARAAELGITVGQLAEIYIARYQEAARALNILPPAVAPRATEHIPEMIAFIEDLLRRGTAYVLDGDVYFDVTRFPGYGKLSGQDPEKLAAGARVDVDERKRHPGDFALWKAARPGEPSWDSPWGKGRPGWHIECSAMSEKYLGAPFDIHAGGIDLMFPHHENEIAQSESRHGHPVVRYWMHNGLLTLDGAKMSKSLGNVVTVSELLARYPAGAIRLFLLSAHYRRPLLFSEEQMRAHASAWERLEGAMQRMAERAAEGGGGAAEELPEPWKGHHDRFLAAMRADFHTADALAALFDAVRDANIALQRDELGPWQAQAILGAWQEETEILGLPVSWETSPLATEVEALIAERNEARRQGDYARADAIRETLRARGVILEDTRSGVRWRLVKSPR